MIRNMCHLGNNGCWQSLRFTKGTHSKSTIFCFNVICLFHCSNRFQGLFWRCCFHSPTLLNWSTQPQPHQYRLGLALTLYILFIRHILSNSPYGPPYLSDHSPYMFGNIGTCRLKICSSDLDLDPQGWISVWWWVTGPGVQSCVINMSFSPIKGRLLIERSWHGQKENQALLALLMTQIG